MSHSSFRGVCVRGATPTLRLAVHRLVEAVLIAQCAPAAVELALHFISPPQMRALHAKHRGLDRPTDVLTFPGSGSGTAEATAVSSLLFAPNERFGETVAERRAAMHDLGDIYVCVEYMWMRCEGRPMRNLPLHAYMQAAVVHAVLHALGYEHDTPQGWAKMARRERFIRERLSLWQRRGKGREREWELGDADLLRHLGI